MAMSMSGVRLFRTILWALVVVAAIGATALFVLRPPAPQGGPGGGEYALIDQRGDPVDQTLFVGKPSLLFFGYTNCPDVCPTTMGEMQGWFAALGDEAKDLQGVFITVDPERDTPEVLDGYVSWVSDRIIGVTGPQVEIDKAEKAWGVLGEKVEPEPGEEGYLMNHTASVLLVDRQGRFFGTIAYGEASDTALVKIRRLLAA